MGDDAAREEGHETRVHVEHVAEGLHERLDHLQKLDKGKLDKHREIEDKKVEAAKIKAAAKTAAKTADDRRRRHLSKYEETSGTYTKMRSICAWDFDASGRLRIFKSEKELLEHETSCGDRRKLGEYPPGGYSRLPTDQQTLAQHIDQS